MESPQRGNGPPTVLDAVTEAIIGRRSVRGCFADRPVEPDVLVRIVTCGLAAPSSKNARPWRLHVVSNRRVLGSIAAAVSASPAAATYVPEDPRTGLPRAEYHSTVAESAEVLRLVPAAVFIENRGVFSGGRATVAAADPAHLSGSLVGYAFELVGIGAAIQNMWLAAGAAGVGAAFMGDVLVAEPEIRHALGIAGDLVGVLALGYSDEPPRPRPEPDAHDPASVAWHR